jgi:hypothetical protein
LTRPCIRHRYWSLLARQNKSWAKMSSAEASEQLRCGADGERMQTRQSKIVKKMWRECCVRILKSHQRQSFDRIRYIRRSISKVFSWLLFSKCLVRTWCVFTLYMHIHYYRWFLPSQYLLISSSTIISLI